METMTKILISYYWVGITLMIFFLAFANMLFNFILDLVRAFMRTWAVEKHYTIAENLEQDFFNRLKEKEKEHGTTRES